MSDTLDQIPAEVRPLVEKLLAPERARFAQIEAENRLLREHIRLLMLQKYGPKSDKLSDLQLELLDREPCVTPQEVEGEAARAAESPMAKTPRIPREDRDHPGRVDLPAHLERRVEVIPVPETDCQCGRCGKRRPLIGHEVSEQLDMEPIKFFVRVVKREKVGGCDCQDGVLVAPAPVRILPKSKLGDELILDFIDQKFGVHVPVFRQCEAIFRNAGVDISRQTACGIIGKVGEFLIPVANHLREDLLAGGYIQADETRFGVQTREKPGKNHTAQIWQYGRPGGPVVFDFRMSRARAGPEEFLKGFQGFLQCDGYQVYQKLGPGIIYLGCMAHARRKFAEAARLSPKDPVPREIVELIGGLYGIEAEALTGNATPEQCRELRQSRSKPAMEILKAKILAAQTQVPPKSLVGRACAYALGQWTRLEVFLGDGRLAIDNNWAENAIRPIVLGRKNFLHIGSEWVGPSLAAIWTIYGTCQRLGKNPRAYLRSILPGLADWPASKIGELSPLIWKG